MKSGSDFVRSFVRYLPKHSCGHTEEPTVEELSQVTCMTRVLVCISSVHVCNPRLTSFLLSEFAHILKCMLFLLKRLNASLWNGETPEFPQVVFDAIKDNPSYIKLIEEVAPLDEKPWFLSWFGEYLLSLKDSGVFGDVLAKIVDLLCEELQHERFKEVRPVVMFAAIRVSFCARYL